MKNYTKAKELMKDPVCADCRKRLTDNDTVVLFQDEQGFDQRDGYFCDNCADFYDENGEF